ncbi:hypothetical protein [Flavihumibacter fluvii]|uniref:hypothetical protein n=1 Tax=Flavihumibacter fluvii TaxID=2838157 RepID=UPI001BDEEE36|nr:hypothetical protein [Flavihumibacter fluvii]ULQ51663.1 hypothetical protein KJS93_16350 [Flavihumibacter fluvii]
MMPTIKVTGMRFTSAVNKWNRLFFIMMITGFSGLFLSSCQKEAAKADTQKITLLNEEVRGTPSSGGDITFCRTTDYCFFAGQTINAGKVVLGNDANNLYVVVYSPEGYQWIKDNIKIWVGTSLATLPTTKNGPNAGTPIPGQFPYKITAPEGARYYTITIPFSQIENGAIDCNKKQIYALVHVDVVANGKAQTGWGGCDGVNIETPGRWYYKMNYTTGCCDNACGCN